MAQGAGKVLIPYLIIILAQLPLLLLYYKNLWQRPYYQSFIFAFIALGVFLYLWWPRHVAEPFRKNRSGSFFLWTGVFFAFLATIFVTPWFAACSTICLLGSLLARTLHVENGKSLLPLVLLLVVFLQPPVDFDFDTVHGDRDLVTKLQQLSSRVSSYFLDIFSYSHLLEGTTILMANPGADSAIKSYNVEEACSGVQSFFTLLFVTSFWIVLFRRPWFRGLLLLISAIFWAVFMNIIRILFIPIADLTFGMDLSSGVAHMLWGYVALAIGILMVLSTDQLLIFLLGPVDDQSISTEDESRFGIARFWNRVIAGNTRGRLAKRSPLGPRQIRSLWIVAGVMVLFGMLQAVDVVRSMTQGGRFFDFDPTMAITNDVAPDRIGDQSNPWIKTQYSFEDRVRSSDLGQRSDSWVYQSPRHTIIASLDQTFPGWHELTTCYKIAGWQFYGEQARVKQSPEGEESVEKWPYIKAHFVNSTGQHGFLLFSLFDRFGEPFDAPSSWGNLSSFFLRVRNRLSHRIRARLFHGEGYQVQIFVRTNQPLEAEEEQQLIDNYLVFRETIRSQFVDGTVQPMSEFQGTPGEEAEQGAIQVDGSEF